LRARLGVGNVACFRALACKQGLRSHCLHPVVVAYSEQAFKEKEAVAGVTLGPTALLSPRLRMASGRTGRQDSVLSLFASDDGTRAVNTTLIGPSLDSHGSLTSLSESHASLPDHPGSSVAVSIVQHGLSVFSRTDGDGTPLPMPVALAGGEGPL
jgi:hypothetical protein